MTMYPRRSRRLGGPRLHVRTPYQSEHQKEMASLRACMDRLDRDPDGTTQELIDAGILYRHPDGSVTLPPLPPIGITAVFFR